MIAVTLWIILWFNLPSIHLVTSISDAGVSSNPYLFDAEGRLSQVELAFKASQRGSTIIAARSSNASIMLSWTGQLGSQTNSASSRFHKLSDKMGVAACGIFSDADHIVNKMFAIVEDHRQLFDSVIPARRLANEISRLVHEHTMSSMLRPFGIRTCLIAYDETNKHSVFEVDPFGSLHDCTVTCLGYQSERILKHWHITPAMQDELSVEELISTAFQALQNAIMMRLPSEGIEEEDTDLIEGSREIDASTIQVAVVGEAIPFSLLKKHTIEHLVNACRLPADGLNVTCDLQELS